MEFRLLVLILNDDVVTLLTDKIPSSGLSVFPHRNINGVLGRDFEKVTVTDVVVPGFLAITALPRMNSPFNFVIKRRANLA